MLLELIQWVAKLFYDQMEIVERHDWISQPGLYFKQVLRSH